MQVILDSSFARPGSAPIWGGKKGEFRDWTIPSLDIFCHFAVHDNKLTVLVVHSYQGNLTFPVNNVLRLLISAVQSVMVLFKTIKLYDTSVLSNQPSVASKIISLPTLKLLQIQRYM